MTAKSASSGASGRMAKESRAQPKHQLATSSQRPSAPMDAPALTRHFLFRIPGELNPRSRPHLTNRQDIWAALIARLNRTVNAFRKHFDGSGRNRIWTRLIHPEGPNRDESYASDSSTFLLTPTKNADFRARLRVSVYLETLAISLIIDRITENSTLRRRISDALAEANGTEAAKQDGAIKTIYDELCGISIPDVRDLMAHPLPLKDEEITEIYGKIGKKKIDLFKARTKHFGGQEDLFTNPIAEFHGLVLPSGEKSFLDHDTPATAEPPHSLTPGIKSYIDHNYRMVERFIGTAWYPKIQGSVREDLAADAVVCGMLGGKVLYASPISLKADQRSRVNYLVAYDGQSEAQLGRFINRLHAMGELRLSALMDFDTKRSEEERRRDLESWLGGHSSVEAQRILEDLFKRVASLVQAGQEIRRIGEELNGLEMRLKYAGNEQSRENESDAFHRQFDDFYAISTQYAALNSCASGGLVFRVERSRYYAETFQLRMADLRIRRIEGWQPYDEFARRYVLQLFEQIAGFGTRYEALGRRIDRFHSWRQSVIYMGLAAATKQQITLSTELQTAALQMSEAAVKQANASRSVQEASLLQISATNALQGRAEDIGIIAVLYYGYGILKYGEMPLDWMYEWQFNKYGPYIIIVIFVIYLIDIIFVHRRIRTALFKVIRRLNKPLRPKEFPKSR